MGPKANGCCPTGDGKGDIDTEETSAERGHVKAEAETGAVCL